MTQPDYDKYYSIEVLDKELSQGNQIDRIKKVADMCEGTVLDVGAGLGKLGLVLKERGYAHKYLALDIRQDYVDYMRKLGLNAEQLDVLHFGYSERYDTVVVADGVEHYDDFGKVLSFATLLAKKKVIITICRNSHDPLWHRWNINWVDFNNGQWNIIEFHKLNDAGDKL